MKLAVAQIEPRVGPVEENVDRHVALAHFAARHGAHLILFPECSLTGYEPALAAELARSPQDACFAPLQSLCDRLDVSLGVGFPLRTDSLPRISTLLFRPNGSPRLYSKQYLHVDEEPFFECGPADDGIIHPHPKVALAICYELSQPAHAQRAFGAGAAAYMASVAKTEHGVEEASRRLSHIASKHSAIVMLANCLGVHAGTEYTGHTAAWGRRGNLLARLDTESEGVIVVDYETEEAVADILSPMT